MMKWIKTKRKQMSGYLYIYMPKWRYKNSNIRSKHKKLEQVLHEVFKDG